MIFPSLKNKVFGYLNLNTEAQKWISEKGIVGDENKLLDPSMCEQMVLDVHKKYSLDYSFGGWMEDRSFLWRGSYLQKERKFIHLGIDLNVSPGTEVAADFNGEVVKIDNDYPEIGGWGTRIIVKHGELPLYMIYAHLDADVLCNVGDTLNKDQIFAKVGKAPFNGNWFPHLHVQTISLEYFNELEYGNRWSELDGYGLNDSLSLNAKRFRDPMGCISLL